MCSEFTISIFWIDHYNSKWFPLSVSIYFDIGALPFLYTNLHWLINFISGDTFNKIIKLCYHSLRNWNSSFYTILKDFLCIHIFQRYSFKKSLRSAPSAFPSLIGKSSSFPSSSSFHKSPASMQKGYIAFKLLLKNSPMSFQYIKCTLHCYPSTWKFLVKVNFLWVINSLVVWFFSNHPERG